ncbi:23S rRNA (adenine(2503)-C(2))-methyltransferase RlmN [Salinispira pacifica]|uniref:Probable dual-specificity RNA methyltransferase RlmN n=1 Tax=Salinispira pacifica TaxID=1307761 RepID=V5WKN6_9SPIO|nr:23S rRNA (adenine(2503)-C(2))-methyltransferase RlmN [Salinispira pacifica]AHC15756.1 Ribosomal RNA large subunit methyltransferase N [Salinispira pacifica]
MTNIFGYTMEELEALMKELGEPAFRAKQLFSWIYGHMVWDFSLMTNLSKSLREKLSAEYSAQPVPHSHEDISSDGTKKYLYPAPGSKFVEAAYIPEETRATLCLSTQVGCKMGCLFCMTARQGFQGQLSVGEILSQVYTLPERSSLTNIVYMGMGEPMDNIDAVIKSIRILTHPEGLHMSAKRITVSTIGVIPPMERFLRETRAQLAISIHNPFDGQRRQLMPVQNVYPIEDVIESLRQFDFSQRKLSFEYIMFDGENDTPEHARRLVKLLNGLRCKVNLIHFHPIPDSPLKGSPRKKMEEFQSFLKSRGIMTTIRRSRGEDIQAACGLLSTLKHVKPAIQAESTDF